MFCFRCGDRKRSEGDRCQCRDVGFDIWGFAAGLVAAPVRPPAPIQVIPAAAIQNNNGLARREDGSAQAMANGRGQAQAQVGVGESFWASAWAAWTAFSQLL